MQQGVVDPQYLYCFLRGAGPQSFLSQGMGERRDPVVSLHYRDVAAVVSASPKAAYESSRRNMVNHAKVQEEVMATHSILPVRFNTIAPDKETVYGMLKDRYDELIGHLDRMEGKIEMGLKAVWFERTVIDEILVERADIRQLRDSLQGSAPERTYYERIRLSELVEVALRQKRLADEETILACVRPFAVATHKNDIFGENMILNAAFLIKRVHEPALEAAIQCLDKQMQQRMLFRYVGPVPPYNFVNIVIHWNWLEYLLTFPTNLPPVEEVPPTTPMPPEHGAEAFNDDSPVGMALRVLELKLDKGEIDEATFSEEAQLLARL